MIRILALVAALAVDEAKAQEPIILERIGAVHMAQPDELRRDDARAEVVQIRPEAPLRVLQGQTPTRLPSQ